MDDPTLSFRHVGEHLETLGEPGLTGVGSSRAHTEHQLLPQLCRRCKLPSEIGLDTYGL